MPLFQVFHSPVLASLLPVMPIREHSVTGGSHKILGEELFHDLVGLDTVLETIENILPACVAVDLLVVLQSGELLSWSLEPRL